MESGTLKPGASVTIVDSAGQKFRPLKQSAPEPIRLKERDLVWKPDRALFIGIGGSGYRILTHIMKNLCDAGKNSLPDGVRFLAINTAEYEKISDEDPLSFAGFSIAEKDVFVFDENLLSPIRGWIANGSLPEHKGWFNPREFPLDEKLDLAGGTRGNRQLARVAFLRNIQGKTKFSEWGKTKTISNGDHSQTKIQTWLTERCRDVIKDNRIRIVITGSLAGGMSGILCDLAILSRKIGLQVLEEGGAVEIEAYFLDSQPFRGLSGSMGDDERNMNCYATLREISRWQINPGNYPQSAGWYLESTEMNDCVREPLFNKLYLFSEPPAGKPRDPRFPNPMDVLIKWIIPSVADVITIMFDTSSGSAGPADLFNQGAAAAAKRLRIEHQLMISRAGIYTVRFPIADILKNIHAQLCLQLVLSRLTGKTSGNVSFDFYEVENLGLPADPASAIDFFLSGELDEVVEGEATPGDLFVKDAMDENYLHLTELSSDDWEIGSLTDHFHKRLSSMIVYILLASNELNPVSPRAGHIAYALEFLSVFLQRLKIARSAIMNHGFERGNDYQIILDAYIQIIQESAENLENFKRKLVSGEGGENEKGLVDILANRAKALDTYINKMDDIYCRKYLWGMKDENGQWGLFRDEWMEKYAHFVINPDNLSRLNWVMNDERELDLELEVIPSGEKGEPVRLGRDGIDRFVTTLEEWLSELTEEVWNSHSLVEIIPEEELFSSREDGMRIAQISQPMMRTDDGEAEPFLVMQIVPDSLQKRFDQPSEFQDEMKQYCEIHETMSPRFHLVRITDPLAAVFLSTQDAINIEKTSTYAWLKREYDRVDGFDSNRGLFIYTRSHHNAVYRADQETRKIEMESGKIGGYLYHPYKEWGQINPLVAGALQFPERAELFCLALADGFIRVDLQGKVRMTDNAQIGPMDIELFNHEVDPYVNALLRFTLQDDLPSNHEQVFLSLQQRYDSIFSHSEQMSQWSAGAPNFWLQGGSHEKKSLGNLTVFLVRWYFNNHTRRWINE